MFNPFGHKKLEEIDYADLKQLIHRQVAEGMFVEYKREMPSAKRLAKSVAAFANSHGGWLFVGIEADQASSAAQNIVGVDLTADPRPLDTLRNAIASHISPHPPYDARLIELPRQSGKGVIVVRVPEGAEPPYMLSDGRIYRRQGAGSDPVFETQRAAVDELYARRDRALDQFRRFAQLPWHMPPGQTGEGKPGWVELYMLPASNPDPPRALVEGTFDDPTAELKWWCEPAQAEVEIEGEKKPFLDVQIPFDSIFPSPLGYCVSQTSTASNPAWLPLSVEASVWLGGGVRVFLPLETFGSKPWIDNARPKLAWPEEPSTFVWIDCRELIRAMMTIAVKTIEFAHRCGAHGPIRFQAQAKNIWLHVLYQDTPAYERMVREVGWPICRGANAQIPSLEAMPPYLEIGGDDNFVFATHIVSAVLTLLGALPAYHGSLETEAFLGADHR